MTRRSWGPALGLRRRAAAILAALALVLPIAIGAAVTVTTEPTEAATGSSFDAGNIISDALFFDGNAMTAAQVQSFLDARVPVCDTWHSGSGVNQPPFTCLKNFSQTHPVEPADAYCAAVPAGTHTAAEIIALVGKACGISQKVLLVLLEKEQSLVTDTWPWDRQYRAATGYGCPDTADCDSRYYGFFNQVVMSAWQFKYYAANPGRYAYKAGQWNNIYYHPDSACGTKSVYIQNAATAALYIYTPYTPNAAALANLYGTGDGCSSYGNRNFWRLYTDWFGSTSDVVCVTNPSQDITRFWNAQGGAGGALGAAVSPGIAVVSGGVTVGHYAKGNVYCSPGVGAIAVLGDIRTKYSALGGATSGLGLPSSAATTYTAGGVTGSLQYFQRGMVLSSASTGTYAVLDGAMRTAWGNRGGSGGTLGWPIGDQESASGGVRQLFQRGMLVVPSSGAAVVLSAAVGTYWSTASNSSLLGAPIGTATNVTAGGLTGSYQNFDRGMVLVRSTGEVFAVLHGPIRNLWGAQGGTGGALGWPSGDQTSVSGGLRQDFQKGTVFVSASGVGATLQGAIRSYWETGSNSSLLGFPTGAQTSWSAGGVTGVLQYFERGMVLSSAATGTHAVLDGPMRTAWGDRGGSGGSVGWPIGDQEVAGGGIRQEFQRGVLTAGLGADVTGDIAIYWGTGTNSARLGSPTGSPVAWTAGGVTGVMQVFQRGTVMSSTQTGTYAVLNGAIRDAWGSQGGSGGLLGWPTGDQQTITGGIRQQFQNGVVIVPTSGTGVVLAGGIADYWTGGTNASKLGQPTGSPISWTASGVSGAYQLFQRGMVMSSADTGTFAVLDGAIRDAWGVAGGSGGSLGWPVGEQEPVSGGVRQQFHLGTLLVTPQGVSILVTGEIYRYWSADSNASRLGEATASPIVWSAAGASGSYQVFQRGMVMSSSTTGTYAVLDGPIRNTWGASGGSGGPLGWPTGDEEQTADGVRQQFQNGAVVVPAAGEPSIVMG